MRDSGKISESNASTIEVLITHANEKGATRVLNFRFQSGPTHVLSCATDTALQPLFEKCGCEPAPFDVAKPGP